MSTLKEQLLSLKKLENSGNKNELKIWSVLFAVQDKELWKDPKYYTGMPEYSIYAEVSFDKLLKDVFNRTVLWFTRMRQITKLKNGTKLLIKHGRMNMITYLHSTENEQAAILLRAEQCVTSRPFSSIKSELFSPLKKIKTINTYKIKYIKLKKEHKKLILKNKKLLSDNRKLKEAFGLLNFQEAA